MEIAGGKMTALVGPSGSGKTSCLSLLKRLYEPQEGEILLDGRPLHHYKRKYLHQKVDVGGWGCGVVVFTTLSSFPGS